jgi:hypothetical protein
MVEQPVMQYCRRGSGLDAELSRSLTRLLKTSRWPRSTRPVGASISNWWAVRAAAVLLRHQGRWRICDASRAAAGHVGGGDSLLSQSARSADDGVSDVDVAVGGATTRGRCATPTAVSLSPRSHARDRPRSGRVLVDSALLGRGDSRRPRSPRSPAELDPTARRRCALDTEASDLGPTARATCGGTVRHGDGNTVSRGHLPRGDVRRPTPARCRVPVLPGSWNHPECFAVGF